MQLSALSPNKSLQPTAIPLRGLPAAELRRYFFLVMNVKCWICVSKADSREHKFKASDLKLRAEGGRPLVENILQSGEGVVCDPKWQNHHDFV